MTSNRPLEEVLQDPNANWTEIRNALKANNRGCTNVGIMKALSASEKNDDVADDSGRSGRVVEKNFRKMNSGGAGGNGNDSGSDNSNGFGVVENGKKIMSNGRQLGHDNGNNKTNNYNGRGRQTRGPTTRRAAPPMIHEEVEEHDGDGDGDDCSGNATSTSTFNVPLSSSTAPSFDEIDDDVTGPPRRRQSSTARQLRNSPSVVSMCQSVNIMDFGVSDDFHSNDSSSDDKEHDDEGKEAGKKVNEELRQHDDDRLREILKKRRNSLHRNQNEQEGQQLKTDEKESNQNCIKDATTTTTTTTKTTTISTKRSDTGESLRMSDKSSDTCYSMSSLGTNGFLGWKNDSDHELDGDEAELTANPEQERRIERSLERLGLDGLRRENEMIWEREMQTKMKAEEKKQDGLASGSGSGSGTATDSVEMLRAATACYKPSSGTSKAFYAGNGSGADNNHRGSGSDGAPIMARHSILNPLQQFFQRKSASSDESFHGTNGCSGASAFHRSSSKEGSTSSSHGYSNNCNTEHQPRMMGTPSALPSRDKNVSSNSIGRKIERSSGSNESFWERVFVSSLQGELDVPENKHLHSDKHKKRHSQKQYLEHQQHQLHHHQPQHQRLQTPKYIPPEKPSPSNSEPKESVNVQDVKMALLKKVQKAPIEGERAPQYFSRRASLDEFAKPRYRPQFIGTVDFDPKPDSAKKVPEVGPVRTLPPFFGGGGGRPKPFATSTNSNEDDNPFRRQRSTSQVDNHFHRQPSMQDDNPFRGNPKSVPALYRVADTKKNKAPKQRRVTLNGVVNPFLLLKSRNRNEGDDYSSESSDEESIELDCSSRHGREWEHCPSFTASILRTSLGPNDNHHNDDYYSSNINIRKGSDSFLDIEAERRKLYETRSSTHTATTAASSSDTMWDEVDKGGYFSRSDAMRRQGSRRWKKVANATGFIRRASLMAEHRPNIGLFGKTLEDEEESDEEDFASSAMW